MTDLKPCPFCGGTDLRAATNSMMFVECIHCGCFGPGIIATGLHVPKPTECDDLWNTRAPAVPVEALKDILSSWMRTEIGENGLIAGIQKCIDQAEKDHA